LVILKSILFAELKSELFYFVLFIFIKLKSFSLKANVCTALFDITVLNFLQVFFMQLPEAFWNLLFAIFQS